VINFRYHLVSLVAVFLALAIGILVGATALRAGVTDALKHEANSERRQISSLLAGNKQLQQQLSIDQAFAQAAARRMVGGLLDGQRAVLVTAPGADGATINGITTALQQAGAKVTGQVALQPAFFDTSASTESHLETLARQLAPAGLSPAAASAQQLSDAQIAGQQQAAAVIAAALVNGDGLGLAASAQTAILSGFANQSYLQVSPSNGATALDSATLAVVIIPATPSGSNDAAPENLALISVTQELQHAGRAAVLAGSYPGSGPGSAIDELNSGNSGAQLSSVDYANTEIGEIMVVQALSQLLTGHKPMSYGVAPGVVPTPAPTPAATASATPAASTPGRDSGRQ
jgi:Copper transport outer membrane protein, MctB